MKALFSLQGIVKHGHHRGKRLGFPTMNLRITKQTLPSEGIYLSRTKIKDSHYNGLTFLGAAKTFGDTEISIETYLLDFHHDVYGETIEIVLLKKLRDNKKFDSEEALIKQMEEDKKQAERFFQEH